MTPNYVITAAHCSHEFEPFNGTVKIGKYYRTKLESGEETFSIAEIKIHPQFSFNIIYINSVINTLEDKQNVFPILI